MKRKWAIVTVIHHTDKPIISPPRLGMWRWRTRRAAVRHAKGVCARLVNTNPLFRSGTCVASISVVKLDKP